jgi:hypothetical protein
MRKIWNEVKSDIIPYILLLIITTIITINAAPFIKGKLFTWINDYVWYWIVFIFILFLFNETYRIFIRLFRDKT